MKKKRSVLFDNEIRLLMHKLLPRKRKGVELLLQNPIVFSSQTGIPTPLEYLRTHFDDYDYFTYRQIMEIINWADNILVDKRHLGSYNRLPNPNTRLEAKIYPNSEKLQKIYEKFAKTEFYP